MDRNGPIGATTFRWRPRGFLGRALGVALVLVVLALVVAFTLVFLAIGSAIALLALARGLWLRYRHPDRLAPTRRTEGRVIDHRTGEPL